MKGRRLAAPGISLAVLRGMRERRQVARCPKTGTSPEVRRFCIEPPLAVRQIGGFAPLPRKRDIPPKVFFKQRRHTILTRLASSVLAVQAEAPMTANGEAPCHDMQGVDRPIIFSVSQIPRGRRRLRRRGRSPSNGLNGQRPGKRSLCAAGAQSGHPTGEIRPSSWDSTSSAA